MNENQLQLLYNDYAKNSGFRDYEEFKSLMSNDNARKVFFDENNSKLGFKDYNEFNGLLNEVPSEEWTGGLLSLVKKNETPPEEIQAEGQPFKEEQFITKERIESLLPIAKRFPTAASILPNFIKTLEKGHPQGGFLVNKVVGGFADFIDDTARGIYAGIKQGGIVEPATILEFKGAKSNSEEINKLIDAANVAQNLKPSEEMVKFNNTYREGGETTFSFLKGLAQNPSIAPELLVTSFSMLTNPESIKAAGGVVGSAAAGGAVTTGGAGAVPAAIASIPYAMGAANFTLENGATFAELLQEELNGKEFNEENVRDILEDESKLNKLRAKSLARGATIGIIDIITGKLAGSVGAKLAKASNAGKIKAALAAGAIESAGGSIGEAAARGVIGQKMDVAEIGLEGIAEAPMAIPSVLSEVLKKPTYKINGQTFTENDFNTLISNTRDEDLAKLNISIDNDKKGIGRQINDRILNHQTKSSILEADPNLTEDQVNRLVPLQRELEKLQSNNTEIAKKRKAQIKEQIDAIQTMEVPETQVSITETPTIESAVIEVGGNIYEGKNHAEAILNAQSDGQDISNIDRQAEGKFRLSDGSIIDRAEAKKEFGADKSELLITQDEASKNANVEYEKVKKELGIEEAQVDVLNDEAKKVLSLEANGANFDLFDNGKLMQIAKDNNIELAEGATNNDIIQALKNKQNEKINQTENVKSMPKGVQGVRIEGERGEESPELRAKEVAPALRDVESTAKALEVAAEDKFAEVRNRNKKVEIGDRVTYTNPLNGRTEVLKVSKIEAGEGGYEKIVAVNDKGEIKNLQREEVDRVVEYSETPKSISEAYHKAKADGSNPELVKAVEELLSKEEAPALSDAEVNGKEFTEEDDKKIKNIASEANTKVGNYVKSVSTGRKDRFANNVNEFEATNPFTNEKKTFKKQSEAAEYVINEIAKANTKSGRKTIFESLLSKEQAQEGTLNKESNIAITTKTSTNENERNQRNQRNQEAKNVLKETGQEPQMEPAPISLEENVTLISDANALNKTTEGSHMVTSKGKTPIEVKNTVKWEQAQIVKRLKKLQKLIDCE